MGCFKMQSVKSFTIIIRNIEHWLYVHHRQEVSCKVTWRSSGLCKQYPLVNVDQHTWLGTAWRLSRSYPWFHLERKLCSLVPALYFNNNFIVYTKTHTKDIVDVSSTPLTILTMLVNDECRVVIYIFNPKLCHIFKRFYFEIGNLFL